MIRFEEIDGLYCPVFVCAQCHEPIQGPGTGLIQWDSYDEPTTFTVLHKGPYRSCSRQWDHEHGRQEGNRVWIGWRSLDKFLAQLTHNTAHPFGADA